MSASPRRVGRSLKPFRRPWVWSVAWMLLFAIVLVLSLLPPRDMPAATVAVNDKIGHFLAYFALMAGAVQLYARRLSWVAMAVLLVGMGIGLEWLQGVMHAGRADDWRDGVADALGVLAGFATGFTPLRDVLLRLDDGRGLEA